jgi:hypothetical protein
MEIGADDAAFGTMKDYAIAATDGELGGVEESCFDDPSWAVRHHAPTSRRLIRHTSEPMAGKATVEAARAAA